MKHKFLILVLVLTLLSGSSFAANKWFGEVSGSNWNTAVNWGGTVPASGDVSYVEQNDCVIATNTAVSNILNIGGGDDSSVTMSSGSKLVLGDRVNVGLRGSAASYTNTFTMNGGTLDTVYALVGEGSMVVNGGFADISRDLRLNFESWDNSSLTITGGTVDVASNIYGGEGGTNTTAAIAVSGGLLKVGGQFLLGRSGTNAGTLTISGGTVDTINRLTVGQSDSATGTLNMTAGTLKANDFMVAEASGATGTVDIAGGVVQIATTAYIGYYGTGTMDVDGGSIDIGAKLIIARRGGSEGTLNMTAGTVNVASEFLLGENATDKSEVNLSGGQLNVNSVMNWESANAVLNISGGTLACENNFVLGSQSAAAMELNMTGGLLTVKGSIDAARLSTSGSAAIDIAGGTIDMGEDHGDGFMMGDATMTISGSDTEILIGQRVAGGAHDGWLSLGEGTQTSTVTMSAGYMFIGDNLAIVDTADTVFNFNGGTIETNWIRFEDAATSPDSDDGIFNLNGGTIKFMLSTANNSSQNARDLTLLNSILADDRFIVHNGDAGWYAQKTAIMDSGNVIGYLVTAVPEPATIALLGLGLGFIARRKRK